MTKREIAKWEKRGYNVELPGNYTLAIGANGDYLRHMDKKENPYRPFLVMLDGHTVEYVNEVIPLGEVTFESGWTEKMVCGKAVGGAYRMWIRVDGPVAWR